MESVNLVCDGALEDHEWVSETTISMQENAILVALNYVIDVPCLWFSSRSQLNQRFAGSGSTIAKYRDVINLAIEATFTVHF